MTRRSVALFRRPPPGRMRGFGLVAHGLQTRKTGVGQIPSSRIRRLSGFERAVTAARNFP